MARRPLLFVVLISLVAGALGLEAAARLKYFLARQPRLYQPHPMLGYTLRPRLHLRHAIQGLDLETDAWGLRLCSEEKSHLRSFPGAKRLLMIGGDAAFGAQVDGVQTVTCLLEAELQRRAPGRFEVANGGVPGYAAEQIVGWYGSVGRFIDADLVVMFLEPDALLSPMAPDALGALHDQAQIAWPRRYLYSYSAWYSGLQGRGYFAPALTRDAQRLAVDVGEASTQAFLASRLRELRRSLEGLQQNLARDQKQLLVMVLFRRSNAVEQKAFYAYESIEAMLTELQILHRCPLAAFRDPNAATYFLDETHLSPAGHARLRDILLKELREPGLRLGL